MRLQEDTLIMQRSGRDSARKDRRGSEARQQRYRITGFALCRSLLVLWSLGLLVCSSFGANSFVLGFEGRDVIGTAVDNLGPAYGLGQDATNCVLRKFGPSGEIVPWADHAVYHSISNLTAKAFCIAP